jgi:hypothetical protein
MVAGRGGTQGRPTLEPAPSDASQSSPISETSPGAKLSTLPCLKHRAHQLGKWSTQMRANVRAGQRPVSDSISRESPLFTIRLPPDGHASGTEQRSQFMWEAPRTVDAVNDALAHERLTGVLELIDRWGDLYERRWGKREPYQDEPGLDPAVKQRVDEVRVRTKFAHDLIAAMGEEQLASKVVEHGEGMYGGHPFTQARIAIVEAIAILIQREELSEIIGPVGPRLSASELHPTIWGAAAGLWDDGHFRASVQTAGTALEGLLQVTAGPGVSGEKLAIVFSSTDPTEGSPRLRLRNVDSASMTSKSAHEGAAALVRGAFMAVRNLMSHPGWPDPSPQEALEMLAVLSYVAHLIDQSDTVTA